MMSNEEEKRCPLCAAEMDWTDQQFKPCKCCYQVCVWCWHHIMDIAEKDVSEGRCPACRTKYEKDKVVAMQANFERVGNTNVNRKSKPPKAKPKANEVRKDLTNVRVIQRKMAYVTGLPLGIADEDIGSFTTCYPFATFKSLTTEGVFWAIWKFLKFLYLGLLGVQSSYLPMILVVLSRPKGMAPPGFSISSRDLPPDFPLSDEIGVFPRTLSGSQSVNGATLIHHPPSMRSFSSAGDTDFVDLAILSCGKGKRANGFSISALEIGSQKRALEDEARLWLLMRRKYADQDGKFSRVLALQTSSAYQDQRFHGADEYAGANNVYGFSPRLVDKGQSFDQSFHISPSRSLLMTPFLTAISMTSWKITNVEMRWMGWQNLREMRD